MGAWIKLVLSNFCYFYVLNHHSFICCGDFLFMSELYQELLVHRCRHPSAFDRFPVSWDELFSSLEKVILKYQQAFLDLAAFQDYPMGFFQADHWIGQSLLSWSPGLEFYFFPWSLLSRFWTPACHFRSKGAPETSLSNPSCSYIWGPTELLSSSAPWSPLLGRGY